MTTTRIPGPAGSHPGIGNGVHRSGTVGTATANFRQAEPSNEPFLTPEQQELALDLSQLVLDIVGIFEPTPFADGANTLISLGRGNWLDAGLSAVGIVPYIGDLAKAGKLPGYARKIHRAIELARQDAKFAEYLRPVFSKLLEALNKIPTDKLSGKVAAMLDSIKKPIESFLGVFKSGRRVWWEVLEEGPMIKGTSIPEWIKMRVGSLKFQIMRNKDKLDAAGNPIGPATKHLAEKARDASEWAKLAQVDFPMSSLAGALEEAAKRIASGKVASGKIFTVEAWELGINTTKKPWVVFHAVYNPRLR